MQNRVSAQKPRITGKRKSLIRDLLIILPGKGGYIESYTRRNAGMRLGTGLKTFQLLSRLAYFTGINVIFVFILRLLLYAK